MRDHNPMALTPKDWDEVAAVPEVRRGWGMEPHENGSDLSRFSYGAKFDFVSGGPGYVGDLFVLTGDAVSAPPIMLIRQEGSLRVAQF